MIHALTLLAILLVAAPLARFIPLATLAAVLFVVAYNMGEWKEIGAILKLARADKAVWAATFALTVVADLTVAVHRAPEGDWLGLDAATVAEAHGVGLTRARLWDVRGPIGVSLQSCVIGSRAT